MTEAMAPSGAFAQIENSTQKQLLRHNQTRTVAVTAAAASAATSAVVRAATPSATPTVTAKRTSTPQPICAAAKTYRAFAPKCAVKHCKPAPIALSTAAKLPTKKPCRHEHVQASAPPSFDVD